MRGQAFILALSLFASSAWSMVVSDPTSYSYYVEQIKQAAEQLKQAQAQVAGIKDVYNQVSGTYNRARGMVEDMKRAEEGMRRDGVLTTRGIGSGIPRNDGGFVDIDKVLAGTHGDGRTRGMQGNDARFEVQQQALKGVIADSEKLMQEIADRLARTGALAAQIDSTANIKDAMDLNNRIAVEILRTLIDMLAIAAKSNQAQALFNYTGVTDAGAKERERVLNDASRTMPSIEEIFGKSKYGKGLPRLGGL